jgi:NAD-reducing hydrogenase large subunit
MANTITIDPVTRIEGHAKVSIHLDDQGAVSDARLHVTQFRGFEKFCEGRPHHEMPSLTARICGICPVSHLIASAKACDALMAVRIPPTADKLRRLLNLAQIIQSHALSFFHLSSPDLLLGLDSDPATRNIFGVLEKHPQIARDGIRLRQMGQQIIEWLGGKRVHPAWVVAGGVSQPLSTENRDRMRAFVPEGIAIAERTLGWFKKGLGGYEDEVRTFANFPTLFMGLVSERGEWEHYGGTIRVMDATGAIVADGLDPSAYETFIGEAVEPWSYLKFPYYKPLGYPDGIYRVGPLARLNLVQRTGGERGDRELAEFHALQEGAVTGSFHFHYARLVEILIAWEAVERLLDDPEILDERVRAFAGPNALSGVGCSEAPRGTLLHHYRIDANGVLTWANLIIATGHNNLAMNRGLLQVAQAYVKADRLQEGMLNRVEAVIRTFDPCLSCSTHALGQMPLEVTLVTADGRELDRRYRASELGG